MLDHFIRYYRGYVHFIIDGNEMERFLNLCRNKGILIWDIQSTNNQYEACIYARDFKKLKHILRKTHTKLRISQKVGFPFYIYRNRHRKTFLVGFILCIILVYIFQLFIWNIQIEGNYSISDETIHEFFASHDMGMYCRKSNVKSSFLVKELRKTYDNITWASVTLEGTCLKVTIKEAEQVAISEKDEISSSICAEKDCKIIKIITRQGTPQVAQGDLVKAGDILVKGEVEIKNDAGEIVEIEPCAADADIIVETRCDYYDEILLKYVEKEYNSKNKKRYFIQIKKHRFYFGFHNHNKNSYEKYESITNVFFNAKYGTESICAYKLVDKYYSLNEARGILSKRFEEYCMRLKENNIHVKDIHVSVYYDDEKSYAKGTIILLESIGKQRSL